MPIENWKDDLTIDSDGYSQDDVYKLADRVWKHGGNGHFYTVLGANWIGDSDKWGVVHIRAGSQVIYVRALNNWHGTLQNGQPRFTEVNTMGFDNFEEVERARRLLKQMAASPTQSITLTEPKDSPDMLTLGKAVEIGLCMKRHFPASMGFPAATTFSILERGKEYLK